MTPITLKQAREMSIQTLHDADKRREQVAALAAPHGSAAWPTHLDLFSGIGGFALAAARAGWKTIALSEIEPYACRVLTKNFPGVPNLGDIRNVRGIPCDLITGGFPCQPYSLAGKRGGASDDRALWPEMLRVIGESKPSWVLGENVPGIVSMELDRVLSDLEAIGYTAWPMVLPACAVDAPHRRDRVWIVAHANQPRLERPVSTRTTRANGCVTECGDDVANTDLRARTGREPQSEREAEGGTSARWSSQALPDDGCRSSEGPRAGFSGPEEPSWWEPEPDVGRVANGIPNRMDRLRGLGNAIVPPVAETILRWMRQIHDDVMRQNDQAQP
jgi:DNA (cytosine-5)-methyltransferase 1